MHSSAMFSQPMDRYVRGLGELINELDGVAEYLNRDWYIELRRELVRLYLDAYYIARAPYDQSAEAPRTEH